MPPKSFQHLFTIIFTLNVLFCVFINPVIYTSLESWNTLDSYEDRDNHSPYASIKILKAVSQDNTTNTTTVVTTTTEETNTTDTKTSPPWNPFLVDETTYYPLALIFSALGILSTIWLIFFVETSKDRTIRERIIGSLIRLILMSLFLGIAIHYWILFEPI